MGLWHLPITMAPRRQEEVGLWNKSFLLIQSGAQLRGQNKYKQHSSDCEFKKHTITLTQRQLDLNQSRCYKQRGTCPVMKVLTCQPAR